MICVSSSSLLPWLENLPWVAVTIDRCSIAGISFVFIRVLVAITSLNVVLNAMKSPVNKKFNRMPARCSLNRSIHWSFILFQFFSMFWHMHRVYLDYDIGMVDRIYIDNGMHTVCHNQLRKIDRMEQYFDCQLFSSRYLVDDVMMDYYDDNLIEFKLEHFFSF